MAEEDISATPAGRLQTALNVLRLRYQSEFPDFLTSLVIFTKALEDRSKAGVRLSEAISRVGELHSYSAQGQNWARLGQSMRDVEEVHENYRKSAENDFLTPQKKKLAEYEKQFFEVAKRAQKMLQEWDALISAHINAIQAAKPSGSTAMIIKVDLLRSKLLEYDQVASALLKELQQAQQKQFVQWSNAWADVIKLQASYHKEISGTLERLIPLTNTEAPNPDEQVGERQF